MALPPDWYRDPAILELERKRIFARTWQLVGHLEEVAEPGSYFASSAGHVPVVVTRDRTGSLNGFVNVCRHRGHLVAQGSGRRETLQCPYHAWTYGLDGSLRRAPRSEREPGFDADGLSLLPLQVDTWGPLVFCNPDLEAGPLAESLGDLRALITSNLDAIRFRRRRDWELPANWKLALENHLERSQGQCCLVWPNLTLRLDPPQLVVEVWRPDGSGRTVGHSDWFKLAHVVSLPPSERLVERFRQLVVDALTEPTSPTEPDTPSV